jgi:hypothetical protein
MASTPQVPAPGKARVASPWTVGAVAGLVLWGALYLAYVTYDDVAHVINTPQNAPLPGR